MKHIGFIFTFGLIGMFFVTQLAVADDKRDAINTISLVITNLNNQDARVRAIAAKTLIAQGDAAVPYLRNVLRARRSFGFESALSFNEAINILEIIGTTNSISELVSIIGDNGQMFFPNVLTKPDTRLMKEFPAYASIIRIGAPAVYCISAKLLDEDRCKLTDDVLCLRALRQIRSESAKPMLKQYIGLLEFRLSQARYALKAIETNAMEQASDSNMKTERHSGQP